MRLILATIVVVAAALFSDLVSAQTGSQYSGDYYLYERTESYAANDGGTVSLLRPTGFDYYEPTWLPPAILIEGPLGDESVEVVRRLAKREPAIRTAFLDSPGGILTIGIQLGTIAHARGWEMVVNAGAECHSACALALLGGKHRKILTDQNRFSFHRQFYLVNGRPVYGNWRRDVDQIARYLLAVDMTAIAAEEIVGTTGNVTLTHERLRRRGITTMSNTEHYQFVLSTAAPTTVYEKFRVACHAIQPVACQDQPVLREPALRMFAILSKELGRFKDLSLVGRNLLTLAVEYKGANQDKILTNDCKLGGNTFFDNLDVRFIEATASNLVQARAPLERRREDLRAWCTALREKQ